MINTSDEMMGTITPCKTAAANIFYILNQGPGSLLYSHSNTNSNLNSNQNMNVNIHNSYNDRNQSYIEPNIGNDGNKGEKMFFSDENNRNRNNMEVIIKTEKKTKDVQEDGKKRSENEIEDEKEKEEEEDEGKIKKVIGNRRNTVRSGTSSPQLATEIGAGIRTGSEIGTGGKSVRLCAESSYLEMMRSMSETVNIGNVHVLYTCSSIQYVWITEVNCKYHIKIVEPGTYSRMKSTSAQHRHSKRFLIYQSLSCFLSFLLILLSFILL